MSASNKNIDYEQLVRAIIEAMLRAQGIETVKVQHDVQIQGISRSHQVDVYWEYRLGGMLHRVITNCKRYTHTVEVTDVLTLSGVLSDMPGVRGLIVTTVGYQKGALEYAKIHNIGLKIVRSPQDSDWDGRVRTIRGQLHITVPEFLSFDVRLNPDWLKVNIGDAAAVVGAGVYDARSTTVRDLTTGSVSDMNDLWNQAMLENPTEVGEEGSGVLRWKDARFEQSGEIPLRIDSIELRWKINPGETVTIERRSNPDAIVRDAIAGILLFVNPDGRVTGDVEKEFGKS